ncbi:hypothetical protein LCGC14_1496570 [marine sediment metagenome]|uniref:Uncharacterized protein n=1 Tax=marine sediment metagenome TaxID=412755 RepID=A0A0F9J5V6_9ZZZZ
MAKKLTKLESLQNYFSKRGYRLEKLKEVQKKKVKFSFRLVATFPLGGIKAGDVVTRSASLAPYERWRRNGFLDRRVPAVAVSRAMRISPKSKGRITPKTPRLRK